MAQNLRYNEQIRISPVRLIDQDNNQIGILDTDEALKRARDAQLDLVEVAPKERPAVCRIMDYGRWKYSQKKRHKKHHHEQQLKEVRIRPKTDDNDRQIKVNRALRFLKKGDKVQFTMVFRGRERAHREIGVNILMAIAKGMGDKIKLERPPSMDGRHMVMIVAPNKHVFDKLDQLEAAKKSGEKPAPASDAEPKPSAEASPETQVAASIDVPDEVTAETTPEPQAPAPVEVPGEAIAETVPEPQAAAPADEPGDSGADTASESQAASPSDEPGASPA